MCFFFFFLGKKTPKPGEGLTGGANLPNQRMTFWSLNGSGSPEGIYRRERKANPWSLVINITLNFAFSIFKGWKCFDTMFQYLQRFQFVQSRERPVHVFNGPGNFILFEIPSRKKHHVVNSSKRLQVIMSITLCGPYILREWRKKKRQI